MKRINNFLKGKRENFIKNNGKKTIGAVMASAIVLSSTIGLAVYQDSTKAYEVRVGEEIVGVVSKKNSLEKVVDSIEKEKTAEYKKEVKLEEVLEIVEVKSSELEITKPEELKLNIEEKVDVFTDAKGLVIEGESVVALKSEEDIKKVIDGIEEKSREIYATEDTVEIHIVQEIVTEDLRVNPSQIKSVEEAIDTVETGGVESIEHEMQPGENFWDLAKEYETSVEEIEEANIEKDPTSIRDGEIIKINSPNPYITIETVEELEIEEDVAFETVYEEDGEMYDNEEEIKVEGKNGKAKKNLKVTALNGVETSREILSEEIVDEPIDRVIVKGTKERPSGIGTGEFQIPTAGYRSSGFGPRWGTMHKGLDIATSTGTPIIASDSGRVEYAGYNSGGYGYMVKVNHGNGFVTLYAHCSEIYVNVGDVVSKGDVISAVGNTGNSTGAHLHFEVIQNGVNVDPENYI